MQTNVFTSNAAAPLRAMCASHPNFVDGQPLLLDFPRAIASIQAGTPTLEGEILRAHLALAASANGSICWIFDSLRASARGDARTGRTIRSAGTDGLAYWTGLGNSKAFRLALASLPEVTQSHMAHQVHTENREDGTSGPAGRMWQSTGFTRTRTQITLAQSAQPAQPAPDADGMDMPDAQPATPVRIRRKAKASK